MGEQHHGARGALLLSSQPFAPGRSHEPHEPRGELRAEDRPIRPVSLRRVARLFAPYRTRLSGLLALICLGAGLGVVSPFLLRGVLDTAIPQKDTQLLTLPVGGMI